MYKLSENQMKNYLIDTFKSTSILMNKQYEIVKNHSTDLESNLKLPLKNYDGSLWLLFEMLRQQQRLIINYRKYLESFNEYFKEDYSDTISELNEREKYVNAQIRGLSVSYIKNKAKGCG